MVKKLKRVRHKTKRRSDDAVIKLEVHGLTKGEELLFAVDVKRALEGLGQLRKALSAVPEED